MLGRYLAFAGIPVQHGYYGYDSNELAVAYEHPTEDIPHLQWPVPSAQLKLSLV